MGGLASKIDGNNMTDLVLKTPEKKTNSNIAGVLSNYKDLFNKGGFYKVSVNIDELSNYLETKFGKTTVESFVNNKKNIEHFDSKLRKTLKLPKNQQFAVMGLLLGSMSINLKLIYRHKPSIMIQVEMLDNLSWNQVWPLRSP